MPVHHVLEVRQSGRACCAAPENHLLQRAQRIAELWTTGFKGMSHYGMTYPMARYIDADANSFDKSLRIHISTRRWNQTGSNATLTP